MNCSSNESKLIDCRVHIDNSGFDNMGTDSEPINCRGGATTTTCLATGNF